LFSGPLHRPAEQREFSIDLFGKQNHVAIIQRRIGDAAETPRVTQKDNAAITLDLSPFCENQEQIAQNIIILFWANASGLAAPARAAAARAAAARAAAGRNYFINVMLRFINSHSRGLSRKVAR
jgi:hypothetical protein